MIPKVQNTPLNRDVLGSRTHTSAGLKIMQDTASQRRFFASHRTSDC
jgi:hypothetical protein